MSKVEVSTDDVIESFCRMLEPGVKKHVLPAEDCNRYGIDVLYNRHDQALIMFHFVTMDMLEVNLELDMLELQKRGKEYLDHLYGLLCDQTEQARKARQEENSIVVDTKPPPKLKPIIQAHNDAMESTYEQDERVIH